MRSIASSSAQLESRFSPDSLPPELLSHIFVFAVFSNRRIRHEVPYEVQLSHVSRRWRGVALSTPLLWTNIVIYSPRFQSWVPSYLQRSGSRLPLSVFIDVYEWDKKYQAKLPVVKSFSLQIYDRLSNQWSRLSKLSIFSFQEDTARLIQSCFATTSAPILESLYVDFDEISIIGNPPVLATMLGGGCPRLTFVESAFIDALVPASCLQNITTMFLHLHITEITYTELVTVLTTATSLLNLSVMGASINLINSWPTHSVGPDPPFLLSKLKCFQSTDSAAFSSKFLLSVSAPSLESVWLDCSYDSLHIAYNAPQMLHPLGASSKFNKVHYLTLRECDLVHSVEFARMFPDITHLHLAHANLTYVERLVLALSTSWRKLDSLILTQARESKWDKFTIALATLFPDRKSDGYPIHNLIMDKDFRKKMEERVPDIADMITVVDLGLDSYDEPWLSGKIIDSALYRPAYVQS